MAFFSFASAMYGSACIISHVGLAVYSTVSFFSAASFGKRLSIAISFFPFSRKVNSTVFITLSVFGNTGR